MEATARNYNPIEVARSKSTNIRTTLYELIEAIDEAVEPGEEWLVATTILHLFNTGKATFLNDKVRI
jgi:hypothetical protein